MGPVGLCTPNKCCIYCMCICVRVSRVILEEEYCVHHADICVHVCVCVLSAAVQGVFYNDGNRQSRGHQERSMSQRAAAHWRPQL